MENLYQRLSAPFRWEPQCRPSSRQRSSTSSSTICTMNPPRSGNVASFPSHGFRGPEYTSSTASSSICADPPSNRGCKPSRILPAPPPTTRAVSAFPVSKRSLLQFQKRVLGFSPSTISWNWKCSALGRNIVASPSLNYVEYPPPSSTSTFLTPSPRSQKLSTLYVPSPFSRICCCITSNVTPWKTPTVGSLL